MKSHGIGDKPIWNTEGSPQCERRVGAECVMNGLSAAEQDAVTARAILTMWLNGVEGFAYYTAEGMGGRTLPLIADDMRGTTAAARHLATLARWMVGAQAVGVTAFGNGGHVIEARRGGERFFVVWSESGEQSFTVPAAWGVARAQSLAAGEGTAIAPDRVLQVDRIPVMLSAAR